MTRKLCIESLSRRDMLTAISFVEHPVDRRVTFALEESMEYGELDGALDEELTAEGIYLLNSTATLRSGRVFGDIDLDGDLDAIVFGSRLQQTNDRFIFIGENTQGEFSLAEMAPLPSSPAYGAYVVDVDQSGSMDLLVSVMGVDDLREPSQVYWYSSVSVSGTFERRHQVFLLEQPDARFKPADYP